MANGNVAGKKMSDYPNVNDTTKVSAAQKEAFMTDAVVVGVGSKPSGQTGKVNYGIPLSEIGGGGDAEALAGHGLLASDGKLTVVTDNTLRIVDAGYLTEPRYKVSVSNAVPAPGADHADVGKVLTVKTVDNSDEIVWDAAPAPSIKGSDTINYDTGNSGALSVKYNSDSLDSDGTNGLKVKLPVPPTTSANNGDVLTVDANGDYDWAPVSGGGGGGNSQIEYLDLTVEWINDQYHLTSATKTLAEMSALIQSGTQVIARVVKRAGDVITNITQIFIGDFYNGTPFSDGSAIWFGLGGSGSVPDNTHYVTVTTMPGSVKWWSDLWEVSDIDGQ